MSYIYHFDESPTLSPEESTHLLGGKGQNLAVMRTVLGLPVPPGFTITTETGRAYLENGWPDGLDDQLREHMSRLEEEVGRSFGGPGEPLLVSVRSGAAVSMPGMMDTILNLGLNEQSVVSLAEACGDIGFARESHQRLETMYRNIVGVDGIPADPWQQLRQAIEAVFRSWDSNRARSYREREEIPDHLGTAVTIQAMVFGNLDDDSATGVLFTRNPATGERKPYGDILFRAQGEDVVAGTHQTEPIERLAEQLPAVAEELFRHSGTLEHHFKDVCDIEFTVERAKLWLLQVRVGKRSPQASLRFAVDMAREEDFPLTRAEAVERVAHHLANPPVSVTRIGADVVALTSGLPASPGLASGRIATTADAAVAMAEEGSDVVLVRPETSPDDVHGMARVKGILTTRGGLASHAAVVARGWGIPAVVGADLLEVRDGTIVVNGHAFAEGEIITINGQSGEIFAGAIETETIVSPEAEVLIAWADELEIDISGRSEVSLESDADTGSPEVAELSNDDVIRAIHIKGFVTAETLAPVLMSSGDVVHRRLEAMQSEGLLKPMGEMFQLNDEGKERAASLMGQDRETWGVEKASIALDDFLPLDARMKDIVTSWQMRDVDGEQVLNDHSDEDYDQGVLERFHELHQDAVGWLRPLTDELERMQAYLARLNRASSQIRAGEHAYIASPRIDSYHNVWFELHEDLIQLAGRTREEEAEAGRA